MDIRLTGQGKIMKKMQKNQRKVNEIYKEMKFYHRNNFLNLKEDTYKRGRIIHDSNGLQTKRVSK